MQTDAPMPLPEEAKSVEARAPGGEGNESQAKNNAEIHALRSQEPSSELTPTKHKELLAAIENIAEISAKLQKAREIEKTIPKEVVEVQKRVHARLSAILSEPIDPRLLEIHQKDPKRSQQILELQTYLLTPAVMVEALGDASDPELRDSILDYVVSGEFAKTFQKKMEFVASACGESFPTFEGVEKSADVAAVGKVLSDYSDHLKSVQNAQMNSVTTAPDAQKAYLKKAKALSLMSTLNNYGARWYGEAQKLSNQVEQPISSVRNTLMTLPSNSDERAHLASKLQRAMSGDLTITNK